MSKGKKGTPSGFPFHIILRKYQKYMMLVVAPTLLVLLALSAYQVVHQFTTQLREEKLLAERSAGVMDTLLANVRATATQTAYAESTLTFMNMDRSTVSNAFRMVYGNVQSKLSLAQASISSAEYLLLYCAKPEYFATVNSGWSTYYDRYDTRRVHPVALVRSLFNQGHPQGWVYSDDTLYFYQPIESRGTPLGALILRFSTGLVDQALRAAVSNERCRMLLIKDGGAVLFDSAGKLHNRSLDSVYPDTPESDLPFFADGTLCLMLNTPSAQSGWRYTMVVELKDFQASLQLTILILLFISVAMLLLSMLVAYRVARSMCRPFETIYTLLSEPTEQASSDYYNEYAAYDELGIIYALIFKTKYLNFSMQSELTAQEQLLRAAQRKALQAQINPHFLFNTLESINWKVMEKLPEDTDVCRMIRSLARILRMNLRINAPLTSVQEELEHARLYIFLQEMRFQDSFSVEWDVEEKTLPLHTVRFSLQPILENAISHGVKLRDGDGLIKVRCHLTEQFIQFTVTDNGPGFDPKVLEELDAALVDSRVIRDEHIGIINLNARIQLIFGTEYRLELTNLEQGAQVVMRIPKTQPVQTERFLQDDAGL